MFEDGDLQPTGVCRLRLMCHPGDMDRFVEIIREALDTYGVKVAEVSNAIPNRKGPGRRVYVTLLLPQLKQTEE
jgi:hypothetical protein